MGSQSTKTIHDWAHGSKRPLLDYLRKNLRFSENAAIQENKRSNKTGTQDAAVSEIILVLINPILLNLHTYSIKEIKSIFPVNNLIL